MSNLSREHRALRLPTDLTDLVPIAFPFLKAMPHRFRFAS
jgi:hypothetical protein